MRNTQNRKLFTQVANSLQGRWYNFANDEVLVFSPAKEPLEANDVLIIKDGIARTDYYLLGFCPTGEIYALIGDKPTISNATIKMITDDSLIMQQPDCKMLIYERRNDTRFADDLIASL